MNKCNIYLEGFCLYTRRECDTGESCPSKSISPKEFFAMGHGRDRLSKRERKELVEELQKNKDS